MYFVHKYAMEYNVVHMTLIVYIKSHVHIISVSKNKEQYPEYTNSASRSPNPMAVIQIIWVNHKPYLRTWSDEPI